MTRHGNALRADIGIIGGSGLYDIEGLRKVKERSVRTPFGTPSDKVVLGELDGIRIAFLSRHGRGHRINPSEINYRANIYALKSLGVQRVISVSAVGSMKESIKPGDVVLPDQFIDFTKRRTSTFFEGGIVAHVAFGEPICATLATDLLASARSVGATVHRGGVYLCVEGPQFSTKGESRLYRQWGVDVIGMTNMPEAKLAREAELCYATVALVTDYDCWHATEEAVTVDAILAVLSRNVTFAKRMLRQVVPSIAGAPDCVCHRALQNAIVTAPDRMPRTVRRKLALLMDRVVAAKKGAR
jgi:5'-methylthioadenosine phosphorylase